MAEEGEVKKEEVVENHEEVARTKGWKPKEEYTGDQSEWVEAKEFLAREPLYKALHKQSRENKRLRETVDEVVAMFKRSEATARERAMAELNTKFQEAANNGDLKGAIEIKDKMRDLETAKEPPKDNSKQESNEAFEEWKVENSWYGTDPRLRRFANGLGAELVSEKLEKTGKKELSMQDVREIYAEVTKAVREEFPDKFMNPNKQRADTVSSTNKRTTGEEAQSKKTPTYSQLPDDAKEVYKRVTKSARNPRGMDPKVWLEMYVAGGGTLN